VIAILVILGVALAIVLVDRWRMRLPDVTDEEFMIRYATLFEGRLEEVLSERRYLGRTLGVSYRKLAPDQTWASLARHAPLIAFSVGTTDVGDDLRDVLSKAGITVPERFPSTIGATIQELIRARRASRAKSE
jgi:hypothetical protein